MSRTKIHINRVAIRMQGSDPALTESLRMRMGQSITTELGSALLNALSQQPELRQVLQSRRSLQINNLTPEPIQVEGSGGDRHPSSPLSQSIAQAVSQAILGPIPLHPSTPSPLHPSYPSSLHQP